MSDSFDYVFYSLLTLMIIMIIASVAAFIFHKATKIDIYAPYSILIVFGLKVADMVTDINLSIEMILQFDNDSSILLNIAAIGSISFIVIPYIINIMLSLNIKRLIHQNNPYFKQLQKLALFELLLISSGSIYYVLTLLSSGLFGFDVFNSGLTNYELRQLVKFKVFGTVLIQNIPQVIFQIIYIFYLNGKPSKNTILSLVLSSYHILNGSLLSFCVVNTCKKRRALTIYQYDLQLQKHIGLEPLSSSEYKNILVYSKRKKALRESICTAFELSSTNIELGFVMLTSNGCKMHVVQYLDVKIDHDDHLNQKLKCHTYITNLYSQWRKEINFMVQKHFDISDDFYVQPKFIVDGDDKLDVKTKPIPMKESMEMQVKQNANDIIKDNTMNSNKLSIDEYNDIDIDQMGKIIDDIEDLGNDKEENYSDKDV